MAGIILNRSRQVPAEETPAFGGIAERFRRAGDLERAIALCRDGLKRFPDQLSARVTLGWSLLDKGQYDDARAELEKVLRKAPDNLAAIRGLAELHDRSEAAMPSLEERESYEQLAKAINEEKAAEEAATVEAAASERPVEDRFAPIPVAFSAAGDASGPPELIQTADQASRVAEAAAAFDPHGATVEPVQAVVLEDAATASLAAAFDAEPAAGAPPTAFIIEPAAVAADPEDAHGVEAEAADSVVTFSVPESAPPVVQAPIDDADIAAPFDVAAESPRATEIGDPTVVFGSDVDLATADAGEAFALSLFDPGATADAELQSAMDALGASVADESVVAFMARHDAAPIVGIETSANTIEVVETDLGEGADVNDVAPLLESLQTAFSDQHVESADEFAEDADGVPAFALVAPEFTVVAEDDEPLLATAETSDDLTADLFARMLNEEPAGDLATFAMPASTGALDEAETELASAALPADTEPVLEHHAPVEAEAAEPAIEVAAIAEPEVSDAITESEPAFQPAAAVAPIEMVDSVEGTVTSGATPIVVVEAPEVAAVADPVAIINATPIALVEAAEVAAVAEPAAVINAAAEPSVSQDSQVVGVREVAELEGLTEPVAATEADSFTEATAESASPEYPTDGQGSVPTVAADAETWSVAAVFDDVFGLDRPSEPREHVAAFTQPRLSGQTAPAEVVSFASRKGTPKAALPGLERMLRQVEARRLQLRSETVA